MSELESKEEILPEQLRLVLEQLLQNPDANDGWGNFQYVDTSIPWVLEALESDPRSAMYRGISHYRGGPSNNHMYNVQLTIPHNSGRTTTYSFFEDRITERGESWEQLGEDNVDFVESRERELSREEIAKLYKECTNPQLEPRWPYIDQWDSKIHRRVGRAISRLLWKVGI